MSDPAKLLVQLTCRECKTALTVTEHKLENGYGSADATCPQCGGQWRYVHTPATGWNRAVDLRAYYANVRETRENQ